MDLSKADMGKALQRLNGPRNGEWKGMDDLDHIETAPVDLKETVHNNIRGEYLVEEGRTKIHLFAGPKYTGKWGPIVSSRITRAAQVLGDGVKVDWVPELESWYIEVARSIPDGAMATRKVVEAFAASASPV